LCNGASSTARGMFCASVSVILTVCMTT
jgi:hypothetical protein